MGHARAIELLYGLSETRPVTPEHLFALHRTVQTSIVTDIDKPMDAWKVEPNGTYAVADDGCQAFIEYAAPAEVPAPMDAWLAALNRLDAEPLDEDIALYAYAKLHLGFVHIHPPFVALCRDAYAATRALFSAARDQQAARDRGDGDMR